MFNAQDTLIDGANLFNISLSDENVSDFNTYYDLLIDWNNKINLTAITDPYEVAVKHFVDSLTILKYVDIKPNSSLIDVGTGAGFPSIPIGILRKDINLTLLDSLNKRLIFLNEVTSILNIKANIVHSRAEMAGQDKLYREKFDFVTSRAVANLSTLSEYCLPLVKIGGVFIAMKGSNVEDELISSNNAISLLGGKVIDVFDFTLQDNSKRNIILIKKISKTPTIYPRKGVKISKNPL